MIGSGVLDIDVGNSRIKWRYTAPGTVQRGVIPRGELERAWEQCSWSPRAIRVGSVGGSEFDRGLENALLARFGVSPRFAMTTARCGDVVCGYRDPGRMGVDRWLAILAAWERLRGACLVLDVGTAATLDFLDGAAMHRGGYIVPGPFAMLDSLGRSTAAVRVDSCTAGTLAPGQATDEAVSHGVLRLLVDFIEQSTNRFQRDCDGRAQLLICGGAAIHVLRHIEVAYRWEPELVLDGLDVALPGDCTNPEPIAP